MHNTETVKVLNALHQLQDELLYMILLESELPGLQVFKHVLTLHVLHDDLVLVTGLEDVNQLDNVSVLTHLEDFDLATLLGHFDRAHFLLLYGFDSEEVSGRDVSGKADHAELTRAELTLNLVEVSQAIIASHLTQGLDPLISDLLLVEVQNSDFCLCQADFHWEKLSFEIR